MFRSDISEIQHYIAKLDISTLPTSTPVPLPRDVDLPLMPPIGNLDVRVGDSPPNSVKVPWDDINRFYESMKFKFIYDFFLKFFFFLKLELNNFRGTLFCEIISGAPYFVTEHAERLSPIVVPSGSVIDLDCKSNGHPTPIIQWYRNDLPLSHSKSERMGTDGGEV